MSGTKNGKPEKRSGAPKPDKLLPKENSMTLPRRALLAMLLLTTQQACSAIQTTLGLPSPSSSVKAVPCTELTIIVFHAPTTPVEAQAYLDGHLPDPKNAYDTPQTTAAVRRNNAAIGAVCGR